MTTSLASRLRSSSAAATGAAWRRLLSNGSRRTEEELKDMSEKTAAATADAAKSAADEARKDAAATAKSAATGPVTEEGCQILVDVEFNKTLREFDSLLKAQRVHMDKEFESLRREIDGYGVRANERAESLDAAFTKKAMDHEGELDKRKAYHDELINISNAKIRDTKYFIAKVAAGSGALVAIAFAMEHFLK